MKEQGTGRGTPSGSLPGRGKGRNRGGGFGRGGFCVCAKCGYKEKHITGVKCTGLKCPECGRPLIREELLNEKRKD